MNGSKRNTDLDRRRLVGTLVCGAEATAFTVPVRAAEQSIAIDVWKSPTCGCCNDWITHLEENGFQVTAHNEGNSDKRQEVGMPVRLGSCHTAVVAGYAVEGHVPARDIHRLLQENRTRWA